MGTRFATQSDPSYRERVMNLSLDNCEDMDPARSRGHRDG